MTRFIQCVQNGNQIVNVRETITAIKNTGFDGVFLQWYNKETWQISQQEQLKLCKALNLPIEFVHLSYDNINSIWIDDPYGDDLIKSYKKDFLMCKNNNINLVVMHLTAKPISPAPSEIGIKRIQDLADFAESLEINIAFENTKIFGIFEYVFDKVKNKNIGICLDSGHLHCQFFDRFNWHLFTNKIIAVHLHDNDGKSDQHLLPYDGSIDWLSFLKNLKSTNYNAPITLESCYNDNYLNISINEFYKKSLERAQKLALLYNKI